MTPQVLSRLSTLLDEALDLDEAAREAWLAALSGDAAELAPTLRRLLARQAAKETCDLLEWPPCFTLPAGGEVPTTVFHPRAMVGPYRLLRSLGHGGMGEVWLAERADGTLKRKVALKLPHVSWAPGLAERFSREREILASLEHPNIARLYDAGFDPQGRPYMALEYVEGLPIDEFCKRRALPVKARLRLLLQVADAVAFAHSRLVIHRDLKPGNILVTENGQVRLLDFGIAKLMEGDAAQETALTMVGGRALTLDYASPEQIRGEPIGTASDVYSLAVVAFELLAGVRPYRLRRKSAAQLEEAIVDADAPRASEMTEDSARKKQLAGDLDAILNKALKKGSAERYATVNALAEELGRWLAGEPVLAQPDRLGYRLRKFVFRHKAAVVTATSLLAIVITASAISIWQAQIAREQTQTAEAVQNFMEDIFRANSLDQADPVQARKTTAEELLNIASRKLDVAMSDSPAARLRMLGLLTGLYLQLGLYENAVVTAKLAVETADKAAMPGDVLLGILEQYGNALDVARRHEEMDVVLQRRIELSRKLNISDSPALARLERGIAYSAMWRESPEAFPHLKRAIELFRRYHDDAGLVDALFTLSELYNHFPPFDAVAARAAALEGLELVKRIQRTPAGAGLAEWDLSFYKALSQSARLLDDPREAVRYGRLAVAFGLSLQQHDDIWARYVSYNLSTQLISAARPLEAIAFLEDTWHLNDSRFPEVEVAYQMLVLMAYARAQAVAGRVDNALATSERATRLSLKIAMEPEWPSDLAESSAMALLQLGKLDLAEEALRKSEALKKASKLSTDTLLPLKAEIDLARGDARAARADVLSWQASTRVAKPLRSRLEADCILGEAALVEGNADDADRLVGDVLRRLESYEQRESLADIEAWALRIRGESLLSRQEPGAAVPVLRSAVTLLEGVVDAKVSLPLASLLGKLAQAQIRTGNVEESRRALDGMRQIHAKYNDVDPAIRQSLALVTEEVDARHGTPSTTSHVKASLAKSTPQQ